MELLDVTCRVPQGSILGPRSFDLYVNYICNVSNLIKFIRFADDANLICADNNLLEQRDMLNREFAKWCIWFTANKLSLNLSKTNYMLFRNRPPDVVIKLCINNDNNHSTCNWEYLFMTI